MGAPAEKKLPNILFILCDDLGYGDLACYGHPHIHTPNLDALADEGLKLNHCYAPSPLCSPARAGFLTGRTPYRTGIQTWIPPDTEVYLHSQEITLATLLKQKGYDTFLAGKWHLNGNFNNLEQTQPQEHGFDHWLATQHRTVPNHQNPVNFFRNGEALGRVEGFSSQILVDEAIQWLENRDNGKPFFQYISTHSPHSEIASPDRFNSMYAEFTDGEPDTLNVKARGPGEYYANVTHLDYELGRLFKKLDELKLSENTLIFFTSDNGPVTDEWRHPWETNMYGSTGGLRGRKADLYEGGIRVPGIVRFPGRIKGGINSDEPVYGCDLLPPVGAIAGLNVPDDRAIDGDDFSPLFQSGQMNRHQPLYFQFEADHKAQYAIRDGDWKLIAYKEMRHFELYNLIDEPAESDNRASQETELLATLTAKMRAINESVAADPLRPS